MPTSPLCPLQSARRELGQGSTGFTLIELLVVVGLIVLITVVALPSVTSYFKVSLSSAAREMASIVKETYNTTAMLGKVHRIVYDLKDNSFWVESGPNSVLLDTAATKERDELKKKFNPHAEEDERKKDAAFAMDKSVTRKKISLPRGVLFEDITTEQSPDPITQGKAYTHFFPHGLTEQTLIHLKDSSDHHMSLIISPLIGQTKVVERYIKKDDPDAL